MKHTPGPWRIKVGGNFGNCIEAFSGKRFDELDDGFRTLCAYQPCEPTGKRDAEDSNALANAQLIASAPDLLEALELCRKHMYAHASNTDDGAFDKLCAAIKKATE